MGNAFDEPPRPFKPRGQAGTRPKPDAKRPVNLSVDAELLAEAKAQGINLSQTLEDELRRLTRDAREDKWREDNRAAFDAYNRFIAEHGVWSAKYRSWGK